MWAKEKHTGMRLSVNDSTLKAADRHKKQVRKQGERESKRAVGHEAGQATSDGQDTTKLASSDRESPGGYLWAS